MSQNDKPSYKSVDEILCDFLDKYNQRKEETRGNKYWSASNLGKCLRYQYYRRQPNFVDSKTPYKWRNNAMDGNSSHEWRQQAVADMGAMVGTEGEIMDKELNYRGHYDLIVQLEDGMTIVDIKNQNNRAFRARRRGVSKVSDEHKMQLGSYFLFVKKYKYPDLKNARIYYINRDTGERDEIILNFTQEFLDSIVTELKTLNKYWDNKQVPPCAISIFCNLCTFRAECKNYGCRPNTKDYTTEQKHQEMQPVPDKDKEGNEGEATGKK